MQDIIVCDSWPQLLSSPASVVSRSLTIPGVSEPTRFLWVAEISLFDNFWNNDDEAKVFPSNLIVQVICF